MYDCARLAFVFPNDRNAFEQVCKEEASRNMPSLWIVKPSSSSQGMMGMYDGFNDIWANDNHYHSFIHSLMIDASSTGRGIFVTNDMRRVPRHQSWLCSRYIRDPCLINGRKFDMRVFVLIRSFDPLRIYVYK